MRRIQDVFKTYSGRIQVTVGQHFVTKIMVLITDSGDVVVLFALREVNKRKLKEESARLLWCSYFITLWPKEDIH